MFERFAKASGVIFDCDGCLLDSMRAWEGVENALIERTGVAWSQDELEEMRAASLADAAAIFHERYGVMDSNEAVVAFVKQTMLAYYTQSAALKPGALAFVTALETAGVPMAVVSSTPQPYLLAGFAHVGFQDAFAGVFSTQETGISKQQPGIYELALAHLGASARSAWGFDDSLYAIRVMNRVGLATVGTYDADAAGSYEELSRVATLAVRTLDELLA